MIPKIIHQTARSADLSWEERQMTRRLRRILRGWDYHFWDDDANAALMRAHFPHHYDRYAAIRFGVAKSDIARYAYLHIHGGWYFDTDYKLLRSIDDTMLGERCVVPLEHGNGQVRSAMQLGNAVMGSEAGNDFWTGLIDFIFAERHPEAIVDRADIIAATGPRAMSDYYRIHHDRHSDLLLPKKNVFQPDIALFALRTSATRDTYGIHLHWGSWRGRNPFVAARIMLRRKLNGLLA